MQLSNFIRLIQSILFVLILYFLRNKLPTDQVLVEAIEFDQIVVCASFFHLAVLHDNDLISITNRTQSMSHNNNCLLSTVDKLVKCLLHQMLRLCVQS